MDKKQTEALRIDALKIAASLVDETGQISFRSSHLVSLIEGYNAARQEIASLKAQPYDQLAMGLCHVCGWKGVIDYPDGPVCVACEHDKTLSPQPAAQPKSANENDSECEAPPIGWRCTRTRGHAGPCAAVVSPEDRAFVERGMRRIRDAVDAERYRCLRSIRHWIIVDGRGYELRDDGLDSAIDDAIAAKKGDAA